MDLQANGFEVLFGASWIWRNAGPQAGPSAWERIEIGSELERWEAVWKQAGSPAPERMFAATLLERNDIVFLGYRVDGVIEAGCIANISEQCIGISNVFSRAPSEHVFAQAAAAVAAVAPDLPVAGYESGADLGHARRAGFTVVSDLRILVAKAARF